MDDFIKFRDSIAAKIDIQLSTFALACQCDYVVCNRFFGAFPKWSIDAECLAHIPDGGRIFLNCVDSNYGSYRETLHSVFSKSPDKRYIFYIMIEPEHGILDILRDICQYSCGFYVNCNVVDDPRVHNMPIGIRDGEEVLDFHRGFSQKMLLNAQTKLDGDDLLKPHVRDIMCLLCFSYTHEERQRCYRMLAGKSFITDLNSSYMKTDWCITDRCITDRCITDRCIPDQSRLLGKVPVEYNYEQTARSVYVISPRGCGEATHRFFEALYLDSIPIVKRTNTVFDRLYAVYPCLIVDDWDKITQGLLAANKKNLQLQIAAFKSKFPGWFQDPATIREIMDLM